MAARCIVVMSQQQTELPMPITAQAVHTRGNWRPSMPEWASMFSV